MQEEQRSREEEQRSGEVNIWYVSDSFECA